jgi:glycosyltransferase involved in cell wall biosynthesis
VLTIVGDGRLAGPLSEQVQRLGLLGRVKMVGLADPAPYLAQADAFCLLSDYEGMPITVLEAMRAGLPIVANQLPGIAEAIAPNGGLLCAANPRAVAEALSTLRNDAMRAYEMGQHSRSIWEERYTASLMAERYGWLYRSMLN